jgi:hypothetical protein
MRPTPGRTVTLALLGLIFGHSLLAENPKEQVNGIVRETQKQGNRSGRITLVWWIPAEFWRAALRATGTVPIDRINEAVKALSDVNVFMVIDAKVGAFATMDYVPAAELQKNLSVTDTTGKPLAMIPEDKQSPGTKNLLAVMKPVIGNMLGEFGKSISFFVFEGKNKDGSRRIDPLKPGSFTARLNEETFRWRLPLGSLLPNKVCPKCQEQFPGNYSFCPFDATPLQEASETK